MVELAIVLPVMIILVSVCIELIVIMYNLHVINDALSTAGSMNGRGVADYSIISSCEQNIADAGIGIKSQSCSLAAPSNNTREITASLAYDVFAKFIGKDEVTISMKSVAYHP
ncbi:MAG: pilus assembly protein [Bdellovibrionota bacterium]